LAQGDGLRSSQPELGLVALAPSLRQPAHLLSLFFDHAWLNLQRRQIRLREVAIVVRFFFRSQGRRFGGDGIEATRFLLNFAAAVHNRRLARNFYVDGALHELERVEVLQLDSGAELAAAARAYRDVGVAAKATLLHIAVVDADGHQDLADGAHVRRGLGTGMQVRLAHDLDQGRPGAIQVDGGSALNAVNVLAGIFFHVHPRDSGLEHAAVQVDAELAVLTERLFVLADLVALGKVRVEVVFSREQAGAVDARSQRQRR